MTVMELRGSPERKKLKAHDIADEDQHKESKGRLRSVPLKRKTKGKSWSVIPAVDNKEKHTDVDRGMFCAELYENVPVCKEIFEVVSKVGEGTFSKVYLARLRKHPNELFALKHVVPTSAPLRVANELTCLQDLGGRDNIIDVKTTIRKEDHTVFVLPYFNHDKFQDYVRKMAVEEVREYLKNLFVALKRVHEHNIIHRDVKPSNFLYSRTSKRYALVDFGLAMQVPGTTGILTDNESPSAASRPLSIPRFKASSQCNDTPSSRTSEHIVTTKSAQSMNHKGSTSVRPLHGLRQRKASPRQSKNLLCPMNHEKHEICTFCKTRVGQIAPRAGTPGFRSPEVLMKLPNQTTAVDIWSAGVILLSILSGRYPFFKASDDMTALAQIITIFGGKEVARESLKFGKEVACSPSPQPQDLATMCEKLRGSRCTLHPGGRRRSIVKGDDAVADNKEESTPIRAKKAKVCKNDVSHSEEKIDQRLTRSRDLANDKLTVSTAIEKREGRSSRTSLGEESEPCLCIPDSAYDLLKRCLCINPYERITAGDALKHPFLSSKDPWQQSKSVR